MRGVYDGELTIGELLQHGDLGLGTFDALDGEMTVVDGIAYRQRSDGRCEIAADDALTPYAAVIDFRPDHTEDFAEATDKAGFEARLDALARSPNLFYAVRVDGQFAHVRFRSVVRQERPYPPLLEVVKTQVVHELEDVGATMVGFRCPDYAVGIGVPGYHLHVITAERTRGGHVLDYCLERGRLGIDHTSSLHLELPETDAFSAADLTAGASAADIGKAES